MFLLRRMTYEFLKVLELVHRWTKDGDGSRVFSRLNVADVLLFLVCIRIVVGSWCRLGGYLELVGDDIVEITKLGVIATVQLHGVVAIRRRMKAGRLVGSGKIVASVSGNWVGLGGVVDDSNAVAMARRRRATDRLSGHTK